MTLNLHKPDITELKPRITVFGVGGGGGNAVNNMITSGLDGVDFVVANTDAQALTMSKAERLIQMGVQVTEGLGAGSQPEVGAAAAQECIDEINDHLSGTHMAFVTAGMGGGTGTGAAPVVANAAREAGILTVGVVTKPFSFEGKRRMTLAEEGIAELQKNVDTLIVIPNQNLFRVANDKTTFADAFSMADQVLYSGVACITDLMVKEGLINLDFADVRSVMREMGRAMMGTGEASGENRAMAAAEAAISNPLLDETSMAGSNGLLISITGGRDMTLFEVDEAATRIREEVDADANIILGATFDESLEGLIRVSVVATGIENEAGMVSAPNAQRMNDAAERLRLSAQARTAVIAPALADDDNGTGLIAASDKSDEEASDDAPATIQIERGSLPEEDEEETTDFADPISDADFQSALDAQIQAPVEVESSPAVAQYSTSQQTDAPSMPVVKDVALDLAAPATANESENGPMGLLKRLATGLGGTQPETSAPQSADSAFSASRETPATKPSTPAAPSAREEDSPYAPARPGALDAHGRTSSSARLSGDEEQLDIPAFLRRQAN